MRFCVLARGVPTRYLTFKQKNGLIKKTHSNQFSELGMSAKSVRDPYHSIQQGQYIHSSPKEMHL